VSQASFNKNVVYGYVFICLSIIVIIFPIVFKIQDLQTRLNNQVEINSFLTGRIISLEKDNFGVSYIYNCNQGSLSILYYAGNNISIGSFQNCILYNVKVEKEVEK